MRWQFGLGLVWALALVFAGSAGLVGAAMMTVAAEGVPGKAAGVGMAVGAVWVMSRGGGRLYDLLIAR